MISKSNQDKKTKNATNNDQTLSHARRRSSKKLQTPVCASDCKKHFFQIKPIGYSSFCSKVVTDCVSINFCNKLSTTLPIIPPQFRGESHIPLFVTSEEVGKFQRLLPEHRQMLRDAISRQNKIDELNDEEPILRRIPKTKNCQICRIRIDNQVDYQQHIASEAHIQRLKNSLGQKYIMEEIEEMEELNRLRGPRKQILELRKIANILKKGANVLKVLANG